MHAAVMCKFLPGRLAVAGIITLSFFLMSSILPHGKSQKYRLVWSDEFNKPGLPDTTLWGYDYGDGCLTPSGCGWGNNELQYYTDEAENARVEDGHLIIEAHRKRKGTRDYSSARLISRHKGDWTYGRIEVRAKQPAGRGTWSAIWMLPTDWAYGPWPASGEIDIMEFVGFMPDSIFGTVHTTRFNGSLGTQQSKGKASDSISSAFHEYGIEWNPEKIDFLFDGRPFHTFYNRHEGTATWPFDLDFHLVLNLAVGGNWGGTKGVDTTVWPQQMVVDYVRVYQ